MNDSSDPTVPVPQPDMREDNEPEEVVEKSLMEQFVQMDNQQFDNAQMNFEKEINEEVVSSQPLVSDYEDFGEMMSDLRFEPDAVQKIHQLSENYSKLRRTRGDGNCFYRAFGCRLVELITRDTEFKHLLPKVKDIFKDSLKRLVERGYQEYTIEEFLNSSIEILDACNDDPDQVEVQFNDQGASDSFVVYLRLLTSLSVLDQEEMYLPFVEAEGYSRCIDFCKNEIEPMGRESDQMQILALARILDIGVCVAYLDNKPGRYISYKLPEDFKVHPIHLLYRPGHYDVIYLREQE